MKEKDRLLKKIENIEQKQKSQCQKNQRVTKICQKKSTSGLSAGRWPRYSRTMTQMAEALVE